MTELEFLKSKGLIKEGFTEFVITGDFGKVELAELLKEYKNEQLRLQGVSISLPDDFWYSDENGNEVYLVGIVKDWCVVENRITEDTWVEPFEFVNALYNDSLKGNEY